MADDIVTRLREPGFCGVAAQHEAADEIERLRAAGNALYAWITVNATSAQQETLSHDEVLDGWEARRG